jgi:tetratricopeptide (TPR) repeat protein
MIINIKHIINILAILLLLIVLPGTALAQKSGKKDKEAKRQDNTGIFLEANTQKLLGNLDAAEALFLKCLSLDPNDAASMYELARIARVQEETAKAIEWAEKAVEQDPKNTWYLKLLSELYQNNLQFDESVKVTEKLIKLRPGDLEYQYELGMTHLLIGNYQKAIDAYNVIEENIGITEEISVQKQKIWQRLKKPEKAIAEIENLSRAWPEESRYKAILAELYLANGMEEKALATYLDIAEKEPDNTYIYISLSDFYRKKGDSEKSIEYLKLGFANPYLDIDTKVQILLAFYTVNELFEEEKENAASLADILIMAHPDDPRAYSIRADLYYRDKKWEEARESLRTVISLDSSRYAVWEQLLFTESQLEDFEAMRNESRRAIELFPQQPLPYLFSAVANYHFEDHRQMIRDLETGIRFVVRNDLLLAEFYNYLGDAYHQTGEDEKAFEAYENSLNIEPDNSIVLNNYAYYLSLAGLELEKARDMSERSLELDPGNASNQDTYGWILYKLGEYEESLEWIGKSIESHEKDNAEVLEHYGDVLYKLGRKKEALEYWKRALNAGKGGTEFLEKKVNEGTLYE